MRLSFRDGKFVTLTSAGTHEVHARDAVKLKRVADRRALLVLERTLVKRYNAPRQILPAFLDPHQRAGVLHILTRSRSYLAHAPGAGKTAQAIVAAVFAEGKGQALFVVPPTLALNWEREVWKWWDRLDTDVHPQGAWPSISRIPESKRRERVDWAADFVICPDSMLTKPWVLEQLVKMPKRLVAVDEASRFKEARSDRTRALFGGKLKSGLRSPGLIQDARHAVLMDGSPMPNRPMELWAPTYAMAPETIDFMDETEYGFRYCGASINSFGRWEFKHASYEPELKARLQKDFMHVVSEKELKHPERLRSLLFMSEDCRSPEQKTWEKKHLGRMDFSDMDEKDSQGDLAKFRRELGMRKVPGIVSYIQDRLKNRNESILLFTWHRAVAETLSHKLGTRPEWIVYGMTRAGDREDAFASFQSGETRLLIGNILAMGRGHNLQNASRVVFGEFSWTDETNIQAEKRASRKGSEKAFIRADYLVCPNSLDERIMTATFNKARSVKRIIG